MAARSNSAVIEFRRQPHLCAMCGVRERCLLARLDDDKIRIIESVTIGKRSLRKGQFLCRAGMPLQALYAIRAGTVKTSLLQADGSEQIISFQMAGDLVGLDAIENRRHACNAVALEDCEICEVPLDVLETMSQRFQPLQREFHRMMSREIVHDHQMMLVLGSMHAEERVAAFLLNLSERFSARGYSPVEFVLRMARADIASYLGLTIETISRVLSDLQDRKLIEVRHRNVRITDRVKLQAITAHCQPAT